MLRNLRKKRQNCCRSAAVDEMRSELNKLFSCKVVIGEGEMDEAPMLYIGEKLGLELENLDIAVDPLKEQILLQKFAKCNFSYGNS